MTDERAPALPAELEEAIRAMLDPAPGGYVTGRVLGLGWATVDTERSANEFRMGIAGSGPFEPGPDVESIGARCAVGRPLRSSATQGTVRIVLVEPITEGRLAATLARRGEGPAAVWIAVEDPRPDLVVSRVSTGPFGPERLVIGGPLGGPHLLIVSGAASTIER